MCSEVEDLQALNRRRRNLATVWLPNAIHDEMLTSADEFAPYETGGVFIGYVTDADIVIAKMIGPGPKAIHRRDSYSPDQEFQLDKIAKHFEDSFGMETYLGDWHTHPAGGTALSIKDKRTLTRVALTPSSQNSEFIMSILGCSTHSWELRTVQFKSGKLMIWPFIRCSYVDLSDTTRYY